MSTTLLGQMDSKTTMAVYVIRIIVEALIVVGLRLRGMGLIASLVRKMIVDRSQIVLAVGIFRIHCNGILEFFYRRHMIASLEITCAAGV